MGFYPVPTLSEGSCVGRILTSLITAENKLSIVTVTLLGALLEATFISSTWAAAVHPLALPDYQQDRDPGRLTMGLA